MNREKNYKVNYYDLTIRYIKIVVHNNGNGL